MSAAKLIKKHEGFRSKMYTDSVGVPTIGYGFNLEQWEMPKAVAELALVLEIHKHRNELRNLDWFEDLPIDKQDALVDMHYNLGHNRFMGFKKMIAALKDKDYERAAQEMLDSRWAEQVGRRSEELAEIIRE